MKQAVSCTAWIGLASAIGAGQRPAVELKEDEIWLIQPDSPPIQITNDGCPKGDRPVWSPDGRKFAFYASTTVSKPHCPTVVVVLSSDGTSLQTIPGLDRGNAVMGIEWLSNERIGIDTHINPSLGQYRIVDVGTGKEIASYFGYAFRPSPDFSHIAHAGSVPHFAPAFAKSDYLMVDDRVAYPSTPENEPNVRSADPADGLLFRDIREFRSGLEWSPDGSRIAFVERLFDWRADSLGSYYGKEEEGNARWWLVVVPIAGGTPVRKSLLAVAGGAATVRWEGVDRVVIESGGVSGEYSVER